MNWNAHHRSAQGPARAVGLAVTAALLLVGCGTSADGGSPSDGGTAKVTGKVAGAITVWTWDGAPGTEAMKKLAAAFEKKTGVKVNSKVVSRDDYKQQAQLALNAGDGIDVLGVQPGQFAAEVQPKLLPVSAYQSRLAKGLDGYRPATVAQIRKLYKGGGIYSVPFGSTGSSVCFYNAKLLDEAGVQPPQTWKDVRKLTDALHAKHPGTLTLVKPSGKDTWFEDEFVLTMAGQQDPGFFNSVRYDGKPWNSAAYVSALKRYGQLYKDGTLQRSGLDMGYTDAMNAFDTGKAAMVCNGSWEAALLKKEYRKANDISVPSVGVIPVPADDPAKRSLRSFLDITWGVPKSAKNPAAAAAFISFATQEKAGVDLWAGDLGFVPSAAGWKLDESVLGDDKLASQGYATIVDLINHAGSDRNNMSSFSDVVGGYVLEVARGRMTAQQAADKGQKDLDSGLYN
ncbi:extracellular solute-binding protein [Streptomyces sp. NPDC004542]|uniref:ABC transporter substrate-binding protein n=1 Tax=Streptomyces sp. NPDC004542 TaxID=3154281 RepID=UPI0033A638C4